MADSMSLEIVGLLDIVGANALEDVAEQIELAIGVGSGGGRRLASRQGDHRRTAASTASTRSVHSAYSDFRIILATFSEAAAHHGAGSIGLPSFRNSI